MIGKPLIRVEMRGGLGNQLFQAAAGYALARRLGAELQFELFHYRHSSKRDFGLSAFDHGGEIIQTRRTLSRRLLKKAGNAFGGLGFVYTPGWSGPCLREQSYSYDPRIEKVEGSCYLRGYFQSWRYFESCTPDIKRIFDPARAASTQAIAFAQEMPEDALCVHVRAGDYLKDPKSNAVHGTLPASYYDHAIDFMRALGRAKSIYCFSDNMEAAQGLLQGHQGITFVQGFNALDDMYLMSRAKSHIIANSTFSYWAAFVAGTNDPCVIAPHAWFTEDELKRKSTRDLYPPTWNKM